MQTHILKCWPQYFDAIKRGEKTFEARRDDRGFQCGDIVELHRTSERFKEMVDFDLNGKPRHVLRFKIGWMLSGQFGIQPGYVILSLLPVPPQEDQSDD